MADFRKEMAVAKEVARGAGAILNRGARRRPEVHLKGRVDLVTEVDLRSEKYITRCLSHTFPHHSILAEEGGLTDRQASHLWVIDPLDGTTNYAHGYPAYCVSVALMVIEDSDSIGLKPSLGLSPAGRTSGLKSGRVDEQIVLGVVYDPIHDEMFHAVGGRGAFLNRRRIIVSRETKLSRSLLATGFPYDIADSRIDNLDNFGRMYKASRGIRRGGSAALDLCYLACGRFDGFWELKLHPWDTAAGMLIVQEAGGRVSRIDGGKYSIFNKDILASNGRIHRQIQNVLRRR